MPISAMNDADAQGGQKAEICVLRVHVSQDENGDFSAVALNLPGVVGCGETEAEAVASLTDGFRAALDVYREDGDEIPWGDVSADLLPAGHVTSVRVQAFSRGCLPSSCNVL